MKFTGGLLALTLVTSAFAEPIPKVKRSLAQYQAVFTGIRNQVNVVGSAVASYVGGSIPGTDVQSESEELVTIINTGAANIATYAALNTLDALALVAPIQALTGDVADVIDALIAAKPNFDGDGLSGEVLTNLQDQRAATASLRNAITPKVPAALQDIAAGLADGINAEIDRGIAAYD
ncbi:hydrophobic surface binding protein A-domain-containing protein [Aspergillus karnatakaensis]|uniref:cell wall mannoprotein 1 family protein n=1 Tax=Aspergillus karnatakaensis TaxID=1810916 RepID=UPI003CCD1333